MQHHLRKLITVVSVVGSLSASAQVTLSPLTTFGVNGWLAPGSNAYLTTGNTERGLAFASGQLFLPSRAGGTFVVGLDPLTGAVNGTLNTAGMTGGTFVINAAAGAADGALYVGNLTTSGTSPFKVYKYSNPLDTITAPTLAYSGNPLVGTRLGDDLAAYGGGSSTLLAAGPGAGSSGYQIIDPTAGTASGVSFVGTPPNAGDFRLGITFLDATHIFGTQGTISRYTSFSGSTGTLIASPTLASSAERPMSYATIAGHNLLAAISTGDNHVSIYDMTDPSVPVLLAQGNNTTGTLAANGNATGGVAWGDIVDNGDGTGSAYLYAMSTNDGIQAFLVTVPEPGTYSLIALGLTAAFAVRKKFRK